MSESPLTLESRFRGFLPVVIDVETGGFNCKTDALLEIAACTLHLQADGDLAIQETLHCHVEPFDGANIEDAALEITGIKPYSPLRQAMNESDAMGKIFQTVRRRIREQGCKRAILVGHNAHFDLGFLNAAAERCGIKRNPFHPFSVFDTATLAGAALGQTVLARAVEAAGLEWQIAEAHSARYDTERTAALFCRIINRMRPIYESAVATAQPVEA